MKLKGKVALITGASRGIGLAIAKALSSEGAKLTICSRSEGDIKLAAQSIGNKTLAIGADVTRPDEVKDLVAKSVKTHGDIDILVNNAGDALSASISETDLELWNRMMASNVTSTFLCIKAVLPSMLERKSGRIINIASIAGKFGGRYISAYSASKHAVLGLTKSVAMEVSDHGVTCNAICPGYVDTPLTERSVHRIVEKTGMSFQQARKYLEQENVQQRFIKPEEVADVAVFLASDAGAGITGESINVW